LKTMKILVVVIIAVFQAASGADTEYLGLTIEANDNFIDFVITPPTEEGFTNGFEISILKELPNVYVSFLLY